LGSDACAAAGGTWLIGGHTMGYVVVGSSHQVRCSREYVWFAVAKRLKVAARAKIASDETWKAMTLIL
jgi:hypothetical protein